MSSLQSIAMFLSQAHHPLGLQLQYQGGDLEGIPGCYGSPVSLLKGGGISQLPVLLAVLLVPSTLGTISTITC